MKRQQKTWTQQRHGTLVWMALERELGKSREELNLPSLRYLGTCGLYTVHRSFQAGAKVSDWNLDQQDCFFPFQISPTLSKRTKNKGQQNSNQRLIPKISRFQYILTKASSTTKNKGKLFLVVKLSGLLSGRLLHNTYP